MNKINRKLVTRKMNVKSLEVVIVLIIASVVTEAGVISRFKSNPRNEYELCVPEELLILFEKMSTSETKRSAKVICISAGECLKCLEKINQNVTDFGTVERWNMYSGMYIAAKTIEEGISPGDYLANTNYTDVVEKDHGLPSRSRVKRDRGECIAITTDASAGTGALTGAAAGAGIGSIVPVAGTALGALIGALAGALAGGGIGGAASTAAC